MKNVSASRMLENIRVLDLSRVLSGPFCGRMLADMGAELIKVESRSGDQTRQFPPFKGRYSSYFSQFNLGKKSVCIDYRRPEGVDLIKRLVAKCDVVLENFRPGLLATMGLGYPVLRKINPRIILCSISGFGQTGPEVKRLAYTDIIQAYSGMDYMAGKMIDEGADPPGFPYSFGDTYASLNAAIAILAALYYREFSGEGQAIDISMLDCLVAANDSTIQKFIFSEGTSDSISAAFRPPLRMKNGHMAVSIALGFEKAVHVIGRPELLEDDRFKTVEARFANFGVFLQLFKLWARDTTVEEASRIFDEQDIPYGKVNSIAEIVESEVMAARNMLVETELPGNGRVRVVNTPIKFSQTPSTPQGPPPRLGQHNGVILHGLLGLSETEVGDLTREGIIYQESDA
jgi:CoA:oxalate CoA-transferase